MGEGDDTWALRGEVCLQTFGDVVSVLDGPPILNQIAGGNS
jgi:hypothetical protein